MDITSVAPLVKTGVISEVTNLWLAIPIGFVFGFGLYHAGFTDSRKIARAFYLKDVGVPVVMFSAIITGMLGLWLLSLVGFIDTSKMYYLQTYLAPMAVGGVLFGVGMAVGGFCPGTAAASIATGRIDAVVFVLGFLGGSILFGDLFPVWGDFFNSDYRGVFRVDQLLDVNLGSAILIMVVAAIVGSILLRVGQHMFWSTGPNQSMTAEQVLKYETPLVMLALLLALVLSLFPSKSFFTASDDWYIIQKQAGSVMMPSPESAATTPVNATTATTPTGE